MIYVIKNYKPIYVYRTYKSLYFGTYTLRFELDPKRCR